MSNGAWNIRPAGGVLVFAQDLFDVYGNALVPWERRRNHEHLAVIQFVPAPIVRPLLQFGEGHSRIGCLS